MSRAPRLLSITAVVALAAALTAPFTTAVSAQTTPCAGVLCAGAASVDMTWHTGAGQGQYGSEGNGLTSDKFDPFHHQTKMVPSDGLQSRAFAKAIVVRGADGSKVAYVKTELYLQQDILTRRVAQLIAGDPLAPDYAVSGLDGSRIMIGGTHNHSAPMYASTAWGVWLFTDAFDFRMFEATARRIASAIKLADQNLEPATIGASVTNFDDAQRNILGPATADDGTPAGFPYDFFDDELSVIRFDALDGRPIAAWANLGMHPESLDGVDLISSDFVGMTERLVERGMGRLPGQAGGPIMAWSQGSVGDVEPDQSRASPQAVGHEYWHRNYAQAELMSRDLAGAVLDTWRDVKLGTPDAPEKFVASSSDLVVDMADYRFAGPETHPAPTVSNCRTQEPAAPVVGLPDCERAENNGLPVPDQWGTTIETLQEAGIPIPDDYGAPSHAAVQESQTIHLQAIRLGDILVASCPCEPISDMVLNFKSRADADGGNLYNGYMWPCEEREDGHYCNFRRADWHADEWRKVDEAAYDRMIAEITNDADGWEEDHASLQGEVEADDPADIYGNYTHEEIQEMACAASACSGYRLPIMVGQANDYVGYVVTHREYMRGDHYRKALTAFGPHTSDYINTRLVRMAGELRGAPAVGGNTIDPAVGPLDELIQMAKAFAIGTAATGGTAGYEAAIPDDGGTPGSVLAQPKSLERFGAATLTWEGGSNWTDNPVVTVQHQLPEGWQTVATQEGGEVVLTLKYDSYASDAPLLWLTGGKAYEWTATWEVFDETTPGTYRFVVDGRHRSDRTASPYHLESAPFDVSAWKGIAAHDLVVNRSSGMAAFHVGGVEITTPEAQLETDEDAAIAADEVHYPDTYESDLDYISAGIDNRDPHRYCYRCTFRPWADTGRIATAEITVIHQDGSRDSYPASFQAGFFLATGLQLASGDTVVVEAGDVIDQYGNVNGAPSNEVSLA
ncbi:MAG: neutral/alkaline non-lysosomal ceramidase N-terminal domain-containing protein [Actinomycetota bacterium]